MRKILNNLSNAQKTTYIISMFFLIIIIIIGIPTLARYKNRNITINTPVWDGTVASSYQKGNGTINNPYIISNGRELAYFSIQLLDNDYENTYFSLNNDIILNKGMFKYVDNSIQYILDDNIYYLDEYSNKYYEDSSMNEEVGTVNILSSLNNFKGVFNGNSYRIYGLYMFSENNEQLALFTNLSGNINDLYVENTMIYGGNITGGIASKTNNSTIKNVLLDGFVISKNDDVISNVDSDINIETINIQDYEDNHTIDLINNNPIIGSEIISTSLTGDYTVNGGDNVSIKINGMEISESFEIELGNTIQDNFIISTYSDSPNAILTFSNVKYNIVYKYSVAGGIIGIGQNTVIKNVVNKADIYGYSVSGGLVGLASDVVNIEQAYNTGSVNSEYISGGLIGNVEMANNVTLLKTYNIGDVSAISHGGLIGSINNNVIINDSFDAQESYVIGEINSNVTIDNVYITSLNSVENGMINGTFVLTTYEDLIDGSFFTSNLIFDSFVDFDDLENNSSNVWVYESDMVPILFIDDISNPIANLYVKTYSWNNLSYEMSRIRLNDNIVFKIDKATDLEQIKEKYYYINNSQEGLTNEEILQLDSWEQYDNIVEINEEGYYIIYVKIVDFDDNITYLNSDLLILDILGVDAQIRMNEVIWTGLNDEKIYTNQAFTLDVEIIDEISEVESIEYYITNEIISLIDLDNVTEWNEDSNITINQVGSYIIYVKITDSFGHPTYLSTDNIIFDGYEERLYIGRNNYYLENNITDNSIITLNFKYNSDIILEDEYSYFLESNVSLPVGTKLTLIDETTNLVYKYQVQNESSSILLNSFYEVGIDTLKSFVGNAQKEYTIIIDFLNTNLSFNLENIKIFLKVIDINDNIIRSTLDDTIKPFNIIIDIDGEDTKPELYLLNDNPTEIILNSDSTTVFNINSNLSYKYIGEQKIIDTTYEDKKTGLIIEFVDSNGSPIDLKNVVIKINEITYYPENDHKYHINISNDMNVDFIMKVITYATNLDIDNGTYYLKMRSFASYDGYTNDLVSNEVMIPLQAIKGYNYINYSFNVKLDSPIVKKNDSLNFNLTQDGQFNSPNIRASLYKKDQLTAYNQDYTIVDLQDYVENSLDQSSDSIYYVTRDADKDNDFELDLLNIENNGYKLVFDLYSLDEKIGTIEKYFIVK